MSSHFARVLDDEVAEVAELPDGDTPAQYFGDMPGSWIACDATVNSRWTYDGVAFHAPVADTAMIANAIKAQCRARILARVSETAQRNLTGYAAKLVKDAVVLGATLSDPQKTDLATADAIFEWINGPGGMLPVCRSLILAGDLGYGDDSKWPAWNDAWSALATKF